MLLCVDRMTACKVCLEPFEAGRSSVGPICGEDCESGVCGECLSQHIWHCIQGTLPGFGARITCPVHLKRLISRWPTLLPEGKSLVVSAEARAAGALELHCASCHKIKSLLIKFQGNPRLDHYNETLRAAIEAFLCGDGSASRVLDEIDIDSKDQFLAAVIGAIEDPERRSTLQLAWLRRFPRVESPCCRHTHCFACAVAGAHEGMSCETYQVSLGAAAQEVIPCPSCGLRLVKGDGCDSVKCPCGFAFRWGFARDAKDADVAKAFERAFPNQQAAAAAAARALYLTSDEVTAAMTTAAAVWARAHGDALGLARAALWRRLHGPLAAPAALHVMTRTGPSHRDHLLAAQFARTANDGASDGGSGEIIAAREANREARARAWGNARGGGAKDSAVIMEAVVDPGGGIRPEALSWVHAGGAAREAQAAAMGKEAYTRGAACWDLLAGPDGQLASLRVTLGLSSRPRLARCDDDPAAALALELVDPASGEAAPGEGALGDTPRRLLKAWLVVHGEEPGSSAALGSGRRMSVARAARWVSRCAADSASEPSAVGVTGDGMMAAAVARAQEDAARLPLFAVARASLGPRAAGMALRRALQCAEKDRVAFLVQHAPSVQAHARAYAKAPSSEARSRALTKGGRGDDGDARLPAGGAEHRTRRERNALAQIDRHAAQAAQAAARGGAGNSDHWAAAQASTPTRCSVPLIPRSVTGEFFAALRRREGAIELERNRGL